MTGSLAKLLEAAGIEPMTSTSRANNANHSAPTSVLWRKVYTMGHRKEFLEESKRMNLVHGSEGQSNASCWRNAATLPASIFHPNRKHCTARNRFNEEKQIKNDRLGHILAGAVVVTLPLTYTAFHNTFFSTNQVILAIQCFNNF